LLDPMELLGIAASVRVMQLHQSAIGHGDDMLGFRLGYLEGVPPLLP
jgi:hypothetical protein